MKQITSTFLLCLFLLSTVGYYPLFLLLSSENKAEVATLIESEKHIETIRIHKSEVKNLVFIEKGEEFMYKGEMYDVKNSAEEGDFIVFHCVHDIKEKNLLADLGSNVKSNTDSKSDSDKKQDDSSKNPVKELFFPPHPIAEVSSLPIVFPFISYPVTSYIPPTLPLPPPEIFIS